MYDILLLLHSWLRWFVLALFLIALYKNYTGWKGNLSFTNENRKVNLILMILLHSQLLIGLILYLGVSPMMSNILSDFGGSMKLAETRFWSVEHLFGMVVAIIIAQIGASKSKKQATDFQKFRIAFIYFLIAFVIIMMMIPWGMWNPERPYFRM